MGKKSQIQLRVKRLGGEVSRRHDEVEDEMERDGAEESRRHEEDEVERDGEEHLQRHEEDEVERDGEEESRGRRHEEEEETGRCCRMARLEINRLKALLGHYRKTLQDLLSTTETLEIEPETMETETDTVEVLPETTATQAVKHNRTVDARKLTNRTMSHLFTPSEMSQCVLSAGHTLKKQLDKVRFGRVLATVKREFPAIPEELVRKWIGEKLSNHAKTAAKQALRQ
jgi:hypothetical protein